MHNVEHMNIVGRISYFFTVNRPLSILLLIAALIFGLTSFWLTAKQYNPEIVRPAFSIGIDYRGATIEEATDRVVYELVEKVNEVPGVDEVYTEVHDGAHIQTTVIFEVGYNASEAKLDLFSQLDQHSYLARGLIEQPSVIEINPETIPVLQIVLGSDRHSIADLRRRAVELAHDLSVVENVSETTVHGGYTPSLVVELNPALLNATGVSLDEIESTLSASQLRNVANGLRSRPHALEIVFDGRAVTPEEVGALVIRDTVRIRDVAHVYEGVLGERSYVLYQSEEGSGEAVMLAAAKVEGSSAPIVTKEFIAALEKRLTRSKYAGIEYQVVSNDGTTASAEIFGLSRNLLTSVAIVSGALLLFLSMRAALVVLIAIPLTLLIVFGLGFLFDQTINRITLFALILSLGLLVDSSIVVVENIHAHLKKRCKEPGISRGRIIAGAVHEIGIGLFLSTATSVIVFLPMAYITGMMGPYMGPIAFFVPAALIVSLLVAIVLTPFVASHLLDPFERQNRLTVYFSSLMVQVTNLHRRFMGNVLASRKKQRYILLGSLGLFIMTLLLPLFGLVHFQMLPRADRDQLYVYVDLPVGTEIETTRAYTEQLADQFLTNADVVHIQQFVGEPPILDFNGMFKGAQSRTRSHQATMRINLTDTDDRSQSSTAITTSLRTALWQEYPSRATFVRFLEEPPGPPVRATFVAKVLAEDAEVQRSVSTALMERINTIDGVVDRYTTGEAPIGRVRYRFDFTAADSLGVTPASAAATLALLNGGKEVSEFIGSTAPEFTPITIGVSAEYRDAPSDIDMLSVNNMAGEQIPLRSILDTTYELRPSRVNFEDAEQVTYVTAEVEKRPIIYVIIDTMRSLAHEDLVGYELSSWDLFSMTLTSNEGDVVELRWGGEWEMTLENFRDLGVAMGVALLLVYGLLVAQYRRFMAPAYILVTVPLGLIGILWGFLILDSVFGIYLTATALIGFIALIGIVVNNAILFLEHVDQKRRRGSTLQESLLAAGEARFRPILLTSLTTILASLTIVSDPVWSGLAWAIVFGLSLSTVLTLIMYPTLLMYFSTKEDDVTT